MPMLTKFLPYHMPLGHCLTVQVANAGNLEFCYFKTCQTEKLLEIIEIGLRSKSS